MIIHKKKSRQEPSRERLFRAAVELFGAKGYRETTVGDIEQAAGLTPRAGGFYRHFQSKEEVLVRAVERMAEEMIAELQVEEIVALKSPRAELLLIARAIMRHAEKYRSLRLILQREGYKLPVLRLAARRANERLGTLDVVPWIENVLKRSGVRRRDPREVGLVIFGPVLLYVLSVDRSDPAFGLKNDNFLQGWADHWANWLGSGGA